MSPEKQDITIAKECPSVAFIKQDGLPYWRRRMEPSYDSDKLTHCRFVPTEDLNAMHEAEGVLNTEDGTLGNYHAHLISVLDCKNTTWRRIHATAAKRAEAFLRTIGKWEDDK